MGTQLPGLSRKSNVRDLDDAGYTDSASRIEALREKVEKIRMRAGILRRPEDEGDICY